MVNTDCTCQAIKANMDYDWVPTEHEPHHGDCPRYVVPPIGLEPQPRTRRLTSPSLPLPLASFIQHAGAISEVTWTSEDDVLRFRGWSKTEHDALTARTWLRRAAKQGMLTARRNPEHGFWEYGPQWRAKDFQTLLDAAQAAILLGAKVDV